MKNDRTEKHEIIEEHLETLEFRRSTKSLLNPCPPKISGEVSANFSAIRVQHEESCINAMVQSRCCFIVIQVGLK